MPQMDGIETTKNLRELGYTNSIVALTANALTGQAEMFLEKGFDDFISKPIDVRQLNSVLNKLVRDKHPLEEIEAARRLRDSLKNNSADKEAQPPTNLQLAEIFTRDAEKAISTLKAIHSNNYRRLDDIQMFIICVHSMKSALINVGEPGLSEAAARLEQAGRDRNIGIMTSEIPGFLNDLKAAVEKIKLKEDYGDVEIKGKDEAYLRKKLLIFQKACVEYDKKTAKDTLAELREKKWPQSVRKMLSVIGVHLLHSDFDEAASVAKDYGK
jgi:CheY-like chemotaxis protein